MIRTTLLAISWAITFFVCVKYGTITSTLKDKNDELITRLTGNTSLCLSQYTSENKYKSVIKSLKRSLAAVRRDVWSKSNLVRMKKDSSKLYGKGGDCGK